MEPDEGHRGDRGRMRLGALVLALLLVGAACGSDEGGLPSTTSGDDRPTVVVTMSIWADVVANVACGDLAEVETLVPVGGDPHGFEPSLADRGVMSDAALIVANGLHLEEGLDDTISAVEADGVPVFRFAEHVETIAFSFGADQAVGGNDDEHADEGDDPHIWFDPERVSAALPELARHLIDDAGLDAAAVTKCLDGYRLELAAVDAEISDLVVAVPESSRKLITSHDALGYFADRYGFEILGTVIPVSSGLAETNPAQLERLAELIVEAGVPVIFSESQHSVDDAEALARRVGDVEVVSLFTGTLGEPGSDADTYVGFLLTNAEQITQSLISA